MNEEKFQWLTVSRKYLRGRKYRVEGHCDCGKSFDIDKRQIPIVLKGASKSFHCETCYNKNIKLPSGNWEWLDEEKKYCISDQGSILSMRWGKELKAVPDAQGFLMVKCGMIGKTSKLHRLVAEKFIPNPENKPYVIHKDGDKNNNKAENLEWVYAESNNIFGQKFNRLLVVDKKRIKDKHGDSRIRWVCKCDCGNVVETSYNELSTGHTQSCGCFHAENSAERNLKHEMTGTPEYISWQAAKTRVKNSNSGSYDRYGGRGISMSKEWEEDFMAFYADMGPKPSSEYTLERKDPNGNYCKENCCWADRVTQAFNQNKRVTNKSGRTGVYQIKPGVWDVRIKKKRIFVTTDFELAVFVREEAELTHYGFIKE